MSGTQSGGSPGFPTGATSSTAQASYTNGAPGTPTYNWSISTPLSGSGSPAVLTSPASSSNNQLQGARLYQSGSASAVMQVQVQDSQGNISTKFCPVTLIF